MKKYFLTANGYDISRNPGRIALFCGLVLALVLGACENPSGGGGNSAAQEAAEEFRNSHRAVLEQSVERATLNDEAAIDAALEAYESLSDEVKAELTAEKEKLDSLKARMNTRRASTAALRVYLEAQPDNTADNPYYVAYTGTASPGVIYDMLGAAGKYVTLDLSKSSVGGFEYDSEEGRKRVVHLILPDSLTEITGAGSLLACVFDGFSSLKTVQAAGLLRVGNYAFANCVSLEEISLPQAENINMYAFSGCTGLKTIHLPEAVTIDLFAFYDCAGLTSVSLPKATFIAAGGFYNCSALTTADLPETLALASEAFAGCVNLTGVHLPKATAIGITGYDSNVFGGCASLTTLDLPEAVIIEDYALAGSTGLTSIRLPKVTTIGDYAFEGCANLTTVILGSTPPTIVSAIFNNAAVEQKTITFKAPSLEAYTGTPWTDKMGDDSVWGTYWDYNADTKANLTVALTTLD
jgi:hypothetical protein